MRRKHLVGGIPEIAERPGERDVDPQLDGPEILLDLFCGGPHLGQVCDVGADGQPSCSGLFDVGEYTGKPCLTAREHGDIPSVLCKFDTNGTPDAGRSAGAPRQPCADSSCILSCVVACAGRRGRGEMDIAN